MGLNFGVGTDTHHAYGCHYGDNGCVAVPLQVFTVCDHCLDVVIDGLSKDEGKYKSEPYA